MARVLLVKGSVREFDRLEDALSLAEPGDVIVVVEGGYRVLEVKAGAGETASGRGEGPGEAASVALVFDQMFRGFAEVVGREVEGVELHEIVGRGLESPVRVGKVTKWPARDDYDVLKTVERLLDEGKRVVFYTGDKKLARQAMALGRRGLRVEYMPPNEYPGKESLARAMIRVAREESRAGD